MCSFKAELIQCARATRIPSLASPTLTVTARSARRLVTDYVLSAGRPMPRAVLTLPSTMKRFFQVNRLPHRSGHAALPLNFLLCERETSETVFINKTTGGLVCPLCKVHGELIQLGPSGAVSEHDSNV